MMGTHRIRQLVRKLMMLDPGYRKACFLEQKIEQRCGELRAAISELPFADMRDDLAVKVGELAHRLDECESRLAGDITRNLADDLAIHRFLMAYESRVANADASDDHYVSFSYPAGYWQGCDLNLGDWMQTLATEAAIVKLRGPGVRFVQVLRNRLTSHAGGWCVMQGWFEQGSMGFLPGPYTKAVWIGTHFTETIRRRLLRLWESARYTIPREIGCRDLSTLEFCRTAGVPAYFSRCLTLTFDRRSEDEARGADMVFCVDCPEWVVKMLPRSIAERAVRISQRNHTFAFGEDLRHTTEALLTRYRIQARLVITTALHCAQPCVAMGIPVVLISPEYLEAERLSAIKGILPLYTRNDLEKGFVDFDPRPVDIESLKVDILRNLEFGLMGGLSKAQEEERAACRRRIADFDIVGSGSEVG